MENYQTILENITDSVLVHNSKEPLYFNKNLLSLLGFENSKDFIQSVAEHGLFGKVHPDDISKVQGYIDGRIMDLSAPPQFYNLRLLDVNQIVRWVNCKISIVDWEGEIATMASLTEVTDMVESTESNRQFEDMFDQVLSTTPAAITLTSLHDGIYHYVNDMFEEMTGYSKKWIIGRSSSDLKIWANESERKFLTKELTKGKTVKNFNCTALNSKGVEIPIKVWGRVINKKPETLILLAVFDRTAEVNQIRKLEALNDQLECAATTDALTGCLNRGAIEEKLNAEFVRSKRYRNKFSLLMLDIDFFKRVNDEYGHDTGDEALKLMVKEISNLLRDCDLLGRWGGEEFLIIAPSIMLTQAVNLAERLRIAIENAHLLSSDGKIIRLTVCIGVSEMTDNECNPQSLVKLADQRLYHAKSTGRNRVADGSDG